VDCAPLPACMHRSSAGSWLRRRIAETDPDSHAINFAVDHPLGRLFYVRLMAVRLAIIGWDSATFDIIDPLISEGRLPVLSSLAGRGARAPLRSTWPPMTDSAWTSAFTSVNPGKHGIFGSWYRAPGAYACRYFSSRDRRSPALWEMTEGVRHLIWNVPMSYPPERVNGAMVAGYGAPPRSVICEPADLQSELTQRWPIEDLLDRAPHGSLEGFLDDLVRGLSVQAEAIVWAAGHVDADCVSVVWPQIDRAQHFFWKFRYTTHHLNGAVEKVYEAMDRATGVLVDAFSEADVLIVSDHGAGTLRGDVNLGQWLVSTHRATYGKKPGSRLANLAWSLPPLLRRSARALAPGVARRAMQTTLTGQLAPFDWERTQAFVGFHGDLWLNLSGREPNGIVAADDADEVLDEVASELVELRDPRTDNEVFAASYRRDEIYSGPAKQIAPDLLLDSWSVGYRIAPNREATASIVTEPASLAGVDAAWSADHRPVGIWIAAGPNIKQTRLEEISLMDTAATALALLDQPVPEGLDGRVVTECLPETLVSLRRATKAAERSPTEEGGYSEEEAAAVAAHLKDLGYLE
jgi:predicted AlkP superfamily phosphohydrolase/phosphomutase